jgi:redox-sensitive bicupin YhaK (pirin superfamily)
MGRTTCRFSATGRDLRVIAGDVSARPLQWRRQETFYGDVVMQPDARLPLPAVHEERAIYVVSGEIRIAGDEFGAGQLAYPAAR